MGRQQVAPKSNEDEDDRDDEEEETDENEDEERDEQQEDDEDDEEGDDLDSALNDRGGKKSEYLKPWRKNGRATIWLHTKAKFAKVPHHKWFEIVTYTKKDEEVSFIRFTRFNCHEPADYVSISKDRDDDLSRSHRAEICPMCKMLEWVEDQVIAGKLSPDQEIFRFDDGDPEHLQVLHAAGISGLIQLENAPERWRKICKKSRVLQKEPWNESLSLKLSHCFQVVDDSDPSGLVYAFEPPDLFKNLKECIADEKEKEGSDGGDPRVTPYAFLWKFDQEQAKKNFGKGNKVIALRKRQLNSKIKKLITGPKRTDQASIVAPGNCLDLRASMENAAQIDMPFDEFFAEAKKAGLMKSSAKPAQTKQRAESRADEDEDEPTGDPKPKTSTKANSATANTKPKKQPDPDPEDDEEQPESKSSSSDAASTCDFCDSEIGDDDFECGACGTSFDQDNNYEIDGIKCKECGTLVPVNEGDMHDDNTSSHICPKCGTIHHLAPSIRHFYDTLNQCRKSGKRFDLKLAWTAEKKAEEKTKGRGRRGAEPAANAKDSKKLDEKLKGDKFNF
jgi:hypothetical protein